MVASAAAPLLGSLPNPRARLIKGLVEAHGGQVWAESRAGRGTTIALTLPVEDAAGAPA